MRGAGRWEIAPDRTAEAALCNGLHGVVTNVHGMSAVEVFEQRPRAVAGGTELSHHQARPEGPTHLSLDLEAHPHASGHHLKWPSPACATGSNCRKSAICPRTDPRGAVEPPVLGAAPHSHRATLRHFHFGHRLGPTHLRGPEPEPLERPTCSKLNDANSDDTTNVVPSEFSMFKNINDLPIQTIEVKRGVIWGGSTESMTRENFP